MLVLSRKPSEWIVIGDRIVVTVVAIRENVVRLGIDAPNEVTVHRGEIAPGSGRRRDPYTGWGVIYATPDVANPFAQRLLTELRERYRGLRAFVEYDPQEQTVTVDPPKDAEVAEANRVGDEIEGLIAAIYEEMSRYDLE